MVAIADAAARQLAPLLQRIHVTEESGLARFRLYPAARGSFVARDKALSVRRIEYRNVQTLRTAAGSVLVCGALMIRAKRGLCLRQQ